MLIILLKTIILLFVVYFVLRIMGKRQLGQMQPFELVITLVVAEVACLPLNDPSIPLYSGIVPIVIIGFLHVLLTFIAQKNLRFRRALDGTSIIVIDKGSIVFENLKVMNMNVSDLAQSARSAGCPDLLKIEYAIFETNGKLSIIKKEKDTGLSPLFPKALIIDGEYIPENLALAKLCKDDVANKLGEYSINDIMQVLYMDIRQNGQIYISLKSGGYKCGQMRIEGEW